MATKDYRYIGNALRYKFSKEHPPKSDSLAEYMPSILSISADVIDLYNKPNNKMQCKMEIANCSVHENCEEESDCDSSKRVFYTYRKEHLLVLEKPEKLDNNLRIDNCYPNEKGNPLGELWAKGVYELAFKVLYQYYEVIPWSMCYWHIDYYEEILASIFLFCPKILCYAIKKELDVSDKADIHVTSAIQKCLDFSIRLDKKIKDEKDIKKKKEREDFYKKILNEINSFHIMRDVEIALTKDSDQNSSIGDVVKKTMEVSSDVVSKTRKVLLEWSKQKDKKVFARDLKKLIGDNNYNYIYENRPYAS